MLRIIWEKSASATRRNSRPYYAGRDIGNGVDTAIDTNGLALLTYKRWRAMISLRIGHFLRTDYAEIRPEALRSDFENKRG
jgi:hypothetical protein